MLKSLEKLKYARVLGFDGYQLFNVSGDELADEIQAEVDDKYMPRVMGRRVDLASNIPAAMDDWCHEHNAEIVDYIDHYYLPRPLFKDGEPVHLGDRAEVEDVVGSVRYIGYASNGWRVFVKDESGKRDVQIQHTGGDRVKRPSEPDTQERIDADAEMGPKAYCEKYGLPVHTGPGTYPRQLQIADLLKRQRDLYARGDA